MMEFTTNIAADLHLEPGQDITGPAYKLISESRLVPLILAGDTFNILRNGREKYRETVRRISEVAGPNGNVMLLEGNHDPEDDLWWLVEKYSINHSLTVGTHMVVPIRDTYVLVTHGYQWCVQWGWGLDLIAQPLFNTVMKISPRLWSWYAERHGWSGPPVNEEQYHAVVLSVWAGALRHASKNDCRVIVGHTHKLGGVVELYDYGLDYVMANPAPLRLGSYIQVTDKIEVKKL